jgi:hypothetical protein
MERCLPLFIVFKSLYWGRLLFLEIIFSLYYFPVGPTSLLGYSSIVQWSSFDFLEYSSLRKVVQEGIPPAATKHQHSLLAREVFFHDVLL